MQLLKPDTLRNLPRNTMLVAPVRTRSQYEEGGETTLMQTTSEDAVPAALSDDGSQTAVEDQEPELVQSSYLETLWERAKQDDSTYEAAANAVREGRKLFPSELQLKVSISECSLSPQGKLLFRGRQWVPNLEELRTKLIQEVHDSKACGHPGRDNCSAILARRFFWPRMSQDVRRFVRNCDSCGRNKAWRNRRQGFLKPLPVPDRIWQEISMDFIVDLPPSGGRTNIIVITDRLGKGVICDGLEDIQAETVAKWFVRNYYRRHYLPRAIVSDRGSQFTGLLWTRICNLLNIKRRLSTAYHPETDGSTERKNQELEAYLRTFVNHAQDDWYDMLPSAEIAINGKDAASTGVSPFFLEHGYHVDPLDVSEELSTPVRDSPIAAADRIVRKLQTAREWAQSAMTYAQQVQEENTNRYRQQSPSYKVGDKVWLDLTNIRTNRPSKKLDAKHAKYTVVEVVGSHSYRLNTPPGIHNVFHSKLLRPASYDPLPSQAQDDEQPPPQVVDDEEEWEVEEIRDEKVTKRGRRGQRKRQFLVKWKGYSMPTWEPYEALRDTAALDRWERRGGG
jgi:hypothetical protein